MCAESLLNETVLSVWLYAFDSRTSERIFMKFDIEKLYEKWSNLNYRLHHTILKNALQNTFMHETPLICTRNSYIITKHKQLLQRFDDSLLFFSGENSDQNNSLLL